MCALVKAAAATLPHKAYQSSTSTCQHNPRLPEESRRDPEGSRRPFEGIRRPSGQDTRRPSGQDIRRPFEEGSRPFEGIRRPFGEGSRPSEGIRRPSGGSPTRLAAAGRAADHVSRISSTMGIIILLEDSGEHVSHSRRDKPYVHAADIRTM